jgi:predicted  nucleic acid-binding Zn-ribbon protein
MQDQSFIHQLERRISAALDRIDSGIDAMAVAAAEAPQAPKADATSTKPDGTHPDNARLAALQASQAQMEAKLSKLSEALSAEQKLAADLRGQNKQLEARLRAQEAEAKALAAKASEAQDQPGAAQLEARLEKMTRQLDVQGLELQRMRKSTIQLREHLRVLHEAAAEGSAEPHLINKAMQAELENLRATRQTETAEMDEILAELRPLIVEARKNG